MSAAPEETTVPLPEGVSIVNPARLFIGGHWVAPRAGGTIEVVSPDTEKVVAVVAEATEPDVDALIEVVRATGARLRSQS